MTASRWSRPVAAVFMAAVVAACGGAPSSAPASGTPPASQPAPSITPSAPSEAISGLFEVDGHDMFLECKGTGSPTVIVETGLGIGSISWTGAIGDLAATTRACRYDRAGLQYSEARPGYADLSVDDRADDLHALLGVAGVDGPYVLAGHSYGGMLIRAFADRFGAETAGLVFIDGSHEDQIEPRSWWMEQLSEWADGAHVVDLVRSRNELLEAADLGALPTIVLTQGEATGELERQWSVLQDDIAAMSSNSLHLVATEAGHHILVDRPELVLDSIIAVVEAARGAPLAACSPRFEALGAECLESTMADLLAAWDAQRAEVAPAAGSLPPGAYSFEEDDVTLTMTIGKGHLAAAISHPDGTMEEFSAEYAAVGDEVTFVWPYDMRIPRTPGVNTATWTVDPDGTIHFVQVDSQPAESWLAHPWVPVEGV